MARPTILSLGIELPTDRVENVEFDDNKSLLDADIIIYRPTSYPPNSDGAYGIEDAKKATLRWQREVELALSAGKSVFTFLDAAEDRRFYSVIPIDLSIWTRSGTKMRPSRPMGVLSTYWDEFGSRSEYRVTFESAEIEVYLKTASGNLCVGGIAERGTGVLFLLPMLPQLDDAENSLTADPRNMAEGEYDDLQAESEKFTQRLIQTLVATARSVRQLRDATPPPSWTQEPQFRLNQEEGVVTAISDVERSIVELQRRKSDLESELGEMAEFRRLLYENGKPLEHAILRVLRLFGFTADGFDDGDSEFDCVFVSPEGDRFLGEAEGKDSSAINIQKLSQLERNLLEDFEREDVTEHARGVLFGNPYRLKPLGDRPSDDFTDKCVKGARRADISLVRTADLFEPARYLSANADADYAKQCRDAILHGKGAIATFPTPPQPNSGK